MRRFSAGEYLILVFIGLLLVVSLRAVIAHAPLQCSIKSLHELFQCRWVQKLTKVSIPQRAKMVVHVTGACQVVLFSFS
jgi:hypothetical protein